MKELNVVKLSEGSVARRSYATPRLTIYGRLAEITNCGNEQRQSGCLFWCQRFCWIRRSAARWEVNLSVGRKALTLLCSETSTA